jgi:hypothetical protein
MHNESLAVVAVRISNPYYSPLASHRSNTAPTPSGFAEIVSDYFPIAFHLQANLIMPEPCPFLSRSFPKCSIIRPTETDGAARGALRGLTDDGLFRGQSPQAFFDLLNRLADEADEA